MSDTQMSDPINPSHYKKGGVECIDAIEAATAGKSGFEAVLTGHVIRYLWRYEEKHDDPRIDVRKALWYLHKLDEYLNSGLTGNEPDPQSTRR